MTDTERFPPEEQIALEVSRLKPGEVYSFDRCAEVSDLDRESNALNIVRCKALEILRNRGVNVKAIHGEGWMRLSEPDRVLRQPRVARKRIFRQFQRTAQDLCSIDLNKLTSDQIRLLSKEQTRLGVLRAFAALRKPEQYEIRRPPRLPRLDTSHGD